MLDKRWSKLIIANAAVILAALGSAIAGGYAIVGILSETAKSVASSKVASEIGNAEGQYQRAIATSQGAIQSFLTRIANDASESAKNAAKVESILERLAAASQQLNELEADVQEESEAVRSFKEQLAKSIAQLKEIERDAENVAPWQQLAKSFADSDSASVLSRHESELDSLRYAFRELETAAAEAIQRTNSMAVDVITWSRWRLYDDSAITYFVLTKQPSLEHEGRLRAYRVLPGADEAQEPASWMLTPTSITLTFGNNTITRELATDLVTWAEAGNPWGRVGGAAHFEPDTNPVRVLFANTASSSR